MKPDIVERKLLSAIEELKARDGFLLEIDVNERSISHKLAEYVEAQFQGWDVDCEYNRDGHRPKWVALPDQTPTDDTHARTVYPDIIVHKRGTRKNLLVIEVKKESNPIGTNFDIQKLQAFIRQLVYEHAVSITLLKPIAEKRYKLEWV